MDLTTAKSILNDCSRGLDDKRIVAFHSFDTPHGPLTVHVTDRLRKKCIKAKLWKKPAMLTALKNAAYGFDSKAGRSRGGSDGIFVVDRDFTPPNAMMKKLFDQFIDKPDELVDDITETFDVGADDWVPCRLVSHHLRLLGVLVGDDLVLVDVDNTK